MGAHLYWHSQVITVTLLQVLRLAKAITCLAVHMYMVQQFPVEALTSDWYYTLSIPSRYPISPQQISWNALGWQAVYGEVLLWRVKPTPSLMRPLESMMPAEIIEFIGTSQVHMNAHAGAR